MNIKEFNDEIIYDDDAMRQLGSFVKINLESLQYEIDRAVEDEFLLKAGVVYRFGSAEYEKYLNEMYVQLAFVKKIIELSDKTHKYLID